MKIKLKEEKRQYWRKRVKSGDRAKGGVSQARIIYCLK
jgi:hypothetical protein